LVLLKSLFSTIPLSYKCLIIQGMSAEEAQEEYMKILKLWSGYGTTLFNVTVSLLSTMTLYKCILIV